MNMFMNLLKRANSETVVDINTTRLDRKNVTQHGTELLKRSKHRHFQIIKTHQCISATKEVWQRNYLATIAKFAELVQEIPASRDYHHSYSGGLLDHSLETMANAVRISTGYILPPGAQAEDIAKNAERWRMGVMIAALLHDVGKVISDFDVMIRTGDTWQKTTPLYDAWPIGKEYKYRYRPKTKGHTKSLHERSALLVFKELVNKKMFCWLQEDPELLQQILDTLTYVDNGKNTIREIIIKADMASVKTALGDKTLKTSNVEIPLADKIMAVIRNMIRNGDMSINIPGASMWSTSDYSFLVSKRVMEDVKLQLKQSGHPNVPNNVDKFFQILLNAGYAEHHPVHTNDIIWLCEIKDHVADWTGKLTFIVFKNSTLISDHTFPTFEGTIELMERNKKDSAHILFTPDGVVNTNTTASLGKSSDSSGQSAPVVPQEVAIEIQENHKHNVATDMPQRTKGKERAIEPTSTILEKGLSTDTIELNDTKIGLRMITKNELAKLSKLGRQQQQTLLMKNPFIHYMITSVKNLSIPCNKINAAVHTTDNYILFVSPTAFRKFFNSAGHTMKEKIYEHHYSTAYSGLQKELTSLGITAKAKGGKNIIEVKVEGREKIGRLHVYAIHRKYFPMMDAFSPNPVISLPSELLD